MVKQLHTNWSLLIAIDLCQPQYQNLLIIYMKFKAKKWRNKNCKSQCEFKGLEKNKLSYRCNECKKKQLKLINGLIKSFQVHTNLQ